jgi:hypothetical protein
MRSGYSNENLKMSIWSHVINRIIATAPSAIEMRWGVALGTIDVRAIMTIGGRCLDQEVRVIELGARDPTEEREYVEASIRELYQRLTGEKCPA